MNSYSEFEKEFRGILRSVSGGQYDERIVFRDFCHAAAMEMVVATTSPERRDKIWQSVAALKDKYGTEKYDLLGRALGVLVLALDRERRDYLGHVYEAMNASVKSFGQFFTPESVSKIMASMTMPKPSAAGKIVKLNDPACGAGVLLIEGAESFFNNGGRQGDLLIYAEDIDLTAAEMAYIQFNLLGYAAVVTHKNSLADEAYNEPWHTVGYHLHKIPQRLKIEHGLEVLREFYKKCSQ